MRNKEQLSYAMEAWLDDGVAKLVAKLKAIGQLDNTMFVFVIDNGWCNGLVSKGSPFEKGVRTPVFFSLPGTVKAAQRFDGLVSTNDIYPTILDYAGVAAPKTAAAQREPLRLRRAPHVNPAADPRLRPDRPTTKQPTRDTYRQLRRHREFPVSPNGSPARFRCSVQPNPARNALIPHRRVQHSGVDRQRACHRVVARRSPCSAVCCFSPRLSPSCSG